MLRAGTKLPAERTLATEFGVSRMTLRAALNQLAEDGVLARSSRSGWFVANQLLGEPPSTLQSFSEMAATRGLRATSRVLERTVRPAELNEAATLAIAPTEPVIDIERLRGFNGTPVCLDRTVIAQALAPELESTDLDNASLYRVLEDAGLSIYRSSYTVHAAAAAERAAALLNVAVGAPMLIGTETAYSADGRPLLLGRTEYRGDAYRFEADLFRQRNH